MDSSKMRKAISLYCGWRYRSADAPDEEWHQAQPLPTTIHLDLLSNGQIPDPFPGMNEKLVQWVGERTWIYQTSFSIPEYLLRNPQCRVAFVAEGLDTFATVTLDGQHIIQSNNMFLSHRADITKQVRAAGDGRGHTVQIVFENVEEKGQELVQRYPEHNWFTFNSGVTRLAVRKAQYHYGWDWGPKILDCGPWKPIYLEIYEARVQDVSIKTRLNSEQELAVIDVALEVEGEAKSAKIEVESEGIVIETRIVDIMDHTAVAAIEISGPKLWWPFTLGDQHLYCARITIRSAPNGEGVALDVVTKKFGIREVELIQQPLVHSEGKSFYFRINGAPIYAAGSCWIPADPILPRISPSKYRDWVSLAKESNQVMLRVWGGGIYEADAFYDACDEQGILVWQDFMFACGIYPAHTDFQTTVRKEIEQNVRRLRHHPSIVIWCGNNEDYAIPVLAKMDYDVDEDEEGIRRSKFPARLLYERLFPTICNELIPEIPYWPGSPYGGSFINSLIEGDVHQWHVWHLDKFPYQHYPRLSGRFITEFGMQAAPCEATVREFFPPGAPITAANYTEDTHVKWHNKSEGAPENLEQYCVDNIPFDNTCLAGYIYGTQLIQSEALAIAFRSWRRLWSGPGKEYCAGALVWQLNDCWPAMSWAIADHNLAPKMAFYAVKRENKPITAGLARNTEKGLYLLEAWASNLTLKDVRVQVTIKAWSARSGCIVWDHNLHTGILLPANQSTELGKVDLDSVKLDPHEGSPSALYSDLVFAIYLSSIGSFPATGTESQPSRTIARHVDFHQPLKETPLQSQADDLMVKILTEGRELFVELRARVPMKGVYLEAPDAKGLRCDDNGVDLVPDEVVKLGLSGVAQTAVKKLVVTWLHEQGWQRQEIPVN